jgi:RNA polymerase sigma-54 factor
MSRIKDTQSDFLARGILFLKPLLQKELAAEFGVHPSTISRAVTEKYVQTPKGLFPVKHLLPRSHKGFTHEKLKSMISLIVEAEDRKNPLSDDEIRNRLAAKGAETARRTVAAYRKELKIPSAKERTEKTS